VYAEVKTKFINPASTRGFRDGNMRNMNIHGGVYNKFIDAIDEERNAVNDGTYLHVFYYTLDLTDPECKTLEVLKTVETKTMAYYRHVPADYQRSSINDVVVEQNGRLSNIKVNYPAFPDITHRSDYKIVLDESTILAAVAQYAADSVRNAAIYGARSTAGAAAGAAASSGP
jgi:hypothetical protein